MTRKPIMPQGIDPSSESVRSRSAAAPEPLRRKRPLAAGPSPLRRRVFRYLLGFAAVVLVADALVGDRGVLEGMRARQQYQELERSIELIRQENAELRGEVRRLRDDPAAIESVAREELGLIKPGEVLFIIRDARPASR